MGEFQSPSLRGSGRFAARAGGSAARLAMFQSPSLRGSGRFQRWRWPSPLRSLCFNPLHCGAVVASCDAVKRVDEKTLVSIPFIAGQWSLLERLRNVLENDPEVSIPFIAGQWSLRRGAERGGGRAARVSIPFIAGQWSLHSSAAAV